MTGVNSRISEYHPETLGIYEKMPGTEEMGFMTPAFKNGIETTGKNITILYITQAPRSGHLTKNILHFH